MTTTRLVFQTLFGVNLIVIMLMCVNYYCLKTQTTIDQILIENSSTNGIYKLDDPFLAFHLMEKLDTYSLLHISTTEPENFQQFYRGLTINPNYCSEHRAHWVNHPEILFEKINLVSDLSTQHQMKNLTLMELNGSDVQEEISADIISRPENRKLNKTFTYPMSLDANMFFFRVGFYGYQLVGRDFSCLSQVSNHIPGRMKMLRKDWIGDTIAEYTKQYATRPQCFDNNKFFPQTFVLWKQDHCEEFFEYFNSEAYEELKRERGIVYLTP